MNLSGAWYISPVSIVTTFIAVGMLFYAVRSGAGATRIGKAVLFLTAFWLVFTMVLGLSGFYQAPEAVPPRILLFGAFPGLVLSIILAIGFRSSFIFLLPLKVLTLIHTVRIPVELVLHQLYIGGSVPQQMTYEGWNFDILSGLTAPLVYLFAFRRGQANTALLAAWNIAALALLVVIISIAILSFPSPLQQIAFEQPNRAVMYFPYVWLPAIVVPIVFFSHLAALTQLSGRTAASK